MPNQQKEMSDTEKEILNYLQSQKMLDQRKIGSQNPKVNLSAKPEIQVRKSVEEFDPSRKSTAQPVVQTHSLQYPTNTLINAASTPAKSNIAALKFRTGIVGFDRLFRQGIPVGNAIIVEGGPGSGKTTFGLQIALEMCKQGKKALYMSFEEPEHRLRQHMINFGWDPVKYEEQGLLLIKRFNALDIARSVEALLSEAKKELLIDIHPVLIPKEFSPDIVCVDSLTSISSAFTGENNRFRVYMEQFFRYLESNNISSFLIREVAHPTHMGLTYTEMGEEISFLSDGIVVLYNVLMNDWTRRRAIEVLKMRGEDIDRRVVEMELVNGKGFVVYPDKTLDETHAKLT